MKSPSIRHWLLFIERTGYLLVLLPFLTDFFETGKWPHTVRDLVTETTMGLLILFYVRVIAFVRRRLTTLEIEREKLTTLLVHDMRSPLSAIMGTLSYLEEHPDDPERRKWIRAALRSCREDVELMSQLLEADRLESKSFVLEKRPVHIPELLRSCAEEISATAARNKIALTVSHTPEVGTLLADESLLRRILMNLLRNAIKYSRPGDRLDVRAETGEDALRVKVSDTGIGIDPAQKDRLFNRYSRIETKEGEPQEGWGLGLYFCKLAVDAHGGKIDIQSQPGQGTLVQFEIPTGQPLVK